MIDKTEHKIDLLLHAIIGQIRLYLGMLKRKCKIFRTFAKRHKKASIIITSLIIVLIVTGLALYRYIPREVTLIVDDSKTIVETSPSTQAKTVGDFLEENEIEVLPQDKINHKMEDEIESGMEIHITKAFNLTIIADKKKTTINTTACTAISAIKKAGVKLKDEDIVVGGRLHRVTKGDKVVVKRVVIKYKKEKVDIPFETKTIRTDKLRIGQHDVVTSGKLGKATKYYKYIYVDKKLYRIKMYKKVVHKEPRTKVIGYGTKISFDGPPAGLSYKKKITVKAVSYHFPGHPAGAGGRPCTYGTIAVDTSVIPMGTRCYVDGYGYAVANDVGSGVKGNKIDLFMEAYFQSLMWGAHETTVYILD